MHTNTPEQNHPVMQVCNTSTMVRIWVFFLKQVLFDIKATGWDLHYQFVVYHQCDDMVQARE